MKKRSKHGDSIVKVLKNQNGFTELWCILMIAIGVIALVCSIFGASKLGQIKQEKLSDEPIYNDVGIFAEGLAYANKEPFGDYGYIDRDGNVVIDFQFVIADSFSEGLAKVAITKNEDIKYGYINKKGEMVIEPQYDWASKFSDGKAMVKKNFHEYIIDTEGKIIEELKD